MFYFRTMLYYFCASFCLLWLWILFLFAMRAFIADFKPIITLFASGDTLMMMVMMMVVVVVVLVVVVMMAPKRLALWHRNEYQYVSSQSLKSLRRFALRSASSD